MGWPAHVNLESIFSRADPPTPFQSLFSVGPTGFLEFLGLRMGGKAKKRLKSALIFLETGFWDPENAKIMPGRRFCGKNTKETPNGGVSKGSAFS